MKATLSVPAEMLEAVVNFVSGAGIDLPVVAGDDCTVQVVAASERRRCGLCRLYMGGGFIACETARSVAAKLGIRTRQMGKLLDFLGIKVRNCGLGCFK